MINLICFALCQRLRWDVGKLVKLVDDVFSSADDQGNGQTKFGLLIYNQSLN